MDRMPLSRRYRDPYRTPSPPPAKTIQSWEVEHHQPNARRHVNHYPSQKSQKDSRAASNGRYIFDSRSSAATLPSSNHSTPSLLMTPSTVKSSPDQNPTPNAINLSDFIFPKGGFIPEEEMEVDSYELPNTSRKIRFPEVYLKSPRKNQETHSYNSSVEKDAKTSEISRSQYTEQPLSTHHAEPRTPLHGRTSRMPLSKNKHVALWLLQNKDSDASSDTWSVNSLESDATDDEFEGAEYILHKKESSIHTILSQQQVATRNFMALIQCALSHLPSETSTKSLAAIACLFQSWMSQFSPSNYAFDCGTYSTINFSQVGERSEHTTFSNGNQKRPLDEDDKDPSDGNDNDPRKKQKLSERLGEEHRQMWACPYYQREPHRYCVKTELGDFRKCAKSPGFPEVHRVKDHLYKCHSQKYCDRCYAVFPKDSELTLHRRSSPACDLKPLPQMEGLTLEQKALLKPRDRSSRSDEERWNVIYKICFPNDQVIPSPYYVHYSREVVEIRREVLEIIREEAQTPDSFDFNRLIQRVQGAFNANETTDSLTPPGLCISTPSTSNTSNTSGNRSSSVIAQEILEKTPSAQRASRLMASATGLSNTLQVSSSDEPREMPDLGMTSDGSPFLPIDGSHASQMHGIPVCEQPSACEPVPLSSFTTPTRELDVDEYLRSKEYSDALDCYWPYPDEVLDSSG